MDAGPDLLSLACTLGPDAAPARSRRWQILHESAALVAHVGGGTLEGAMSLAEQVIPRSPIQ